jgi:hypothetical protein
MWGKAGIQGVVIPVTGHFPGAEKLRIGIIGM